MPESSYRARDVGNKTREVVEYHRDDTRPGKPLHIIVPGGLIALAVLALIIYIAYRTWYLAELEQGTGLTLIGILSPFYVGGVFLFSYGYELYNVKRALRLTAIIVFVTLAAVVIVAVLFFLLGDSKGGSSKSSSSSDSKSSSKSSSSGSSKASYSPSSSSSSSGSRSTLGDGIYIGGGSGRVIHTTETREVVREVPVAPRSIECPFCHHSYVPADQKYACPSCGAATPKEWIERSEAPQQK
jgi:hypothetical protein